MLGIDDILLKQHRGAKITSTIDHFDLFKHVKEENKCVGISIADTIFIDKGQFVSWFFCQQNPKGQEVIKTRKNSKLATKHIGEIFNTITRRENKRHRVDALNIV